MSIFEATNYRSWMKSWLHKKGITQKEFCERNSKALAFSSFVNFLNGTRNLSLPVFLDLLSAFGLQEKEKHYALLLKQENDLDPRDAANNAAIELLHAMRKKLLPFLRGDYEGLPALQPEEATLLYCFARLSEKQKKNLFKYIEEFLHEQNARQKSKRDIQRALDRVVANL